MVDNQDDVGAGMSAIPITLITDVEAQSNAHPEKQKRKKESKHG